MWSLVILGIAFPFSVVCNGGLVAKSPVRSAVFGMIKNGSSFSTTEKEKNGLGKLIDQSASSNRSPRQVDYRAEKGVYKSSSRLKRPFYSQSGSSHPNFETARGKNWCAYVHTRLSPTVTIENEQTFVMQQTNPCPLKLGYCQPRYQILNRPTYRMRHKIVTSLEWKCCPGYTGATCQPTDQHLRRQAEENQAESQITGAGVPQDPQQPHDPALTAKFSDKLYNQEIKLGILRRKVENISANMNDVRSVLYSLEGKINEDQGKNLQSTSKATKSKGIQELIKDLVMQQIQLFQDNTQDIVTQLYKTISGLTEELQSTKDAINQLNSTILSLSENSQSRTLKQNYTAVLEFQEIREEMKVLRTDIAAACNGTSQEMNEKVKSLQAELKKESNRIDAFYETMNHTFSQVMETQDRLDSNQIFPDATVSEEEGGQWKESFQKNLLNITKNVNIQGHMISQLYAEVNVHRLQLFNLTHLVGDKQEMVIGTCQEMVEECKSNTDQLDQMENKLHNLNNTFTDIFTSLEDFLASMNERISILSYDVEILQSVNEGHVPVDETGTAGYGFAAAGPVHGAANRAFPDRSDAVRGAELASFIERFNNLSVTVNSLVASIKDAGDGSPLGNQNQAGDESLTNFLAECRLEIEDGLNDTMTVINDAVDSMRDGYYILKNNVTELQEYVLELYHKNIEKQSDVLSVIPQLTQLNASFKAMLDDLVRHQFALETIGGLQDLKESEISVLPNLMMMSQLLNRTVATIEDHQQMIHHLEEAVLHSPPEPKDYEPRILALESQLNSLMGRLKSSTKRKAPKRTQGEVQPAPPKYQVLSHKVTGLQSKWVNLNKRLSQVEEVTGKTWGLCQNLSLLIAHVNTSISKAAVPVVKPNITALQEELRDFMQSISEATVGMFFTNITVYMDRSISNVVRNFTKFQKQIKQLYRRPRISNKANITTNTGRSQRNADKDTFPVESTSCNSSPCQNGGTCINQRKGFVCACRPPFGGPTCDEKLLDENALKTDFSKGSYRYAPMVTFFVAHTYEMKTAGPIKFNHLYVNYGAGYAPGSGKFLIPYLGVYVFEYNIESSSPHLAGYLVVDGVDKLAFQSKDMNNDASASRVVTGDAMLELNYGQRVWLRLTSGSIPAKFPPVTTFGGYLLYRT
ncbi:multimerin-1-like isoform X1 [Chiloscyllium plagiosum]|uniref:multimerin-1-like isoform X1 n=2 Tax=Chiloscyllium plagiosum TaxID=36176 RepID=UPI001CB8465E|nr:multimerin-1-like isoform X1 [Chiloscyllium plagiosum]